MLLLVPLFTFLLSPLVTPQPVILLVLEGLTEDLLSRVATPALDSLQRQGALLSLTPEFPSETLPTLQSMVTGLHTERTGLVGSRVRGGQEGEVLGPEDQGFWEYGPNITTIWHLNNQAPGHKTGTVLWPGADQGGRANNLRWGTSIDIEVNVSTGNITEVEDETDEVEEDDDWYGGMVKGPRTRRELEERQDVGKEPVVSIEEGQDVASNEGQDVAINETVLSFDLFEKTTDKEWLMWEDQIQTVLGWMTSSQDPVDLVLMLVQQPGGQVRLFGPDSEEAEDALSKVDQMVASMMEQLARVDLGLDKVNILVTGAHGFTEVTTEQVLDISSLADTNDMVGSSPLINLQPADPLETFAKLQEFVSQDSEAKFQLWTRRQVPERLHYSQNTRVSDIVLLAKEGVVFAHDFYPTVKQLNSLHGKESSLTNKYGWAGYDPSLASMQSVLVMAGPGVQTRRDLVPDHKTPSLQAVDMFPLLAHLLELKLVPGGEGEGSIAPARGSLRSPPSHTVEVIKQTIKFYTEQDRLPSTVGVLVGSTALLVLLICCCACCLRRSRVDLASKHDYKYSQVKTNRRTEGGRVEVEVDLLVQVGDKEEDKVGLLTSTIMEDDLFEDPI